MRRIAAALVLALLAACTQDPPGTCTSDAQCGGGTICSNGVCAGCDSSADCNAWQGCNVGAHACAPLAGRCNGKGDCAAWELCDGTHTCVLAPNHCYTQAECASYEDCTNHACVPQPGFCNVPADCQPWQTCDSSHVCVLGAGACDTAGDCASYKDCTAHFCTLQAGRCDAPADCGGWWPSCEAATNTCHSAPPGGNDVAIFGTLAPGYCSAALAPLSSPTSALVGFSCAMPTDMFSRRDGSIVYINHDLANARAVRFVPDTIRYDAVNNDYDYPSTGTGNDPIMAATGCASNVPVTHIVVREDTGTVGYQCDGVWFDQDGATSVTGSLLAWNSSDVLLGGGSGGLTVWTAGPRTLQAVSGLPFGFTLIDARASLDGFLVALAHGSGPTTWELWRVDAGGTPALVGTYDPASPPGVNAVYSTPSLAALDRNGLLYARGVMGTIDVVVKFAPDGSPGVVVYSEANAPPLANVTPTNLYVLIYDSPPLSTQALKSPLFRGP
jgi:hypothetical protein